MRNGFPRLVDGLETLDLVECLGGATAAWTLDAKEYEHRLLAVLYALSHSAGSLFRAVYASRVALSDTQVAAISKIAHPALIESLELNECGIDASSFGHILYTFAGCTSSILRTLILTDNPIGDKDMSTMLDVISQSHKRLETLKIGASLCPPPGIVVLTAKVQVRPAVARGRQWRWPQC